MDRFIQPKSIYSILLTFILLLGVFFRFHNTPIRYSVGDDSSRDAMVVFQSAKELQLPLLGPFSSLGPFTFGPWYYYELIFFKLLTHFSYAAWIWLGIASSIFIFIMYKIGSLLGNRQIGLLAAFFAAISPPQISSAVGLTNPNLISLHAGLVILLFIFLIKIKKNLSYWFSFLFGLVLGIGINIHYQMAGFLIFPLMLLFYKRKKYLYFATCLVGIFISFVPILIFNLTNHWYLVRNLLYFYLHGKDLMYVPNRWLFYLRDFWPLFWSNTLGTNNLIGVLLIILSFAMCLFTLLKRKISIPLFLFLIAFLFNFLLLRYYWGERFLGYLQYLHPFIFFLTSFSLWQLFRIKVTKFFAALLFLLVVITAFPQSINELKVDPFDNLMQQQSSFILKHYPNKKISIYNCNTFYKVSSDAITIITAEENRLGNKDNIKVGLGMNNKCFYPKGEKYYPKIPKTGAYDFSKASDSNLIKARWSLNDPKFVSDSVTRWWFKEKP